MIVSEIERGDIREKRRLVLEAAQIEDLRTVLDAADDRNRQPAKRREQGVQVRGRRRAAARGRIAKPALGTVSIGNAPEPIWLAQATTSTAKAAAELRC